MDAFSLGASRGNDSANTMILTSAREYISQFRKCCCFQHPCWWYFLLQLRHPSAGGGTSDTKTQSCTGTRPSDHRTDTLDGQIHLKPRGCSQWGKMQPPRLAGEQEQASPENKTLQRKDGTEAQDVLLKVTL